MTDDDAFYATLRTQLLHCVALLDSRAGLMASRLPADREAAAELTSGPLARSLHLLHTICASAAGAASFAAEMHAEAEEAEGADA